jgi:hypothetical protein
VLAKKLYLLFPDELDELALFSRIAAIGCMLLAPLTLLLEGRAILSWLLPTSSSAAAAASLTEISTAAASPGAAFLPLLLLFNGATYCSYNVLSFFVLSRTDIIVHAILNVCRRMTIIVFTAYYFGVHVSSLNAAGVVLALFGVLLFSARKK